MKALILLAALLTATGLKSQENEVADSLLTTAYIQSIHLREPDRALQLLDVAEARHLPKMPLYRIQILRALCYGAKFDYPMKEKYARLTLAHDSVRTHTRRRLHALDMLQNALEQQAKYEECIAACQEAVELCRKAVGGGNITSECRALNQMGRVYTAMGRTEEGIDAFGQAIAKMEAAAADVRQMAELSLSYGELMTVLMRVERYDEAVAWGEKRQELIGRMAGMTPSAPPGYIDQQYGYLYAKLAYLYQKTGRAAEARRCYEAFLQTDLSREAIRGSEIIPYLLETGGYADALSRNRRLEAAFGSDTINDSYQELLNRYARIHRGLGQYREADDYQQRFTVLCDSLHRRAVARETQRLATQFRVKEQEYALREARTLAQRRVLLLLSSAVIVVLLVLLLALVSLHLQRMRRRNRIAARQIDELLAQREEQRLFLQPDFGRDELLRISRFTKNSLGDVLQRYAQAKNVAEYLNGLRVEYALKLMKEKGHLSMEAIAQEAGFNSRSTFYRAFDKATGMTPNQYLKQLKEEAV